MHSLTTHAGQGMLKTERSHFGGVRYRLNILGAGAGGTLFGDGATIVTAWLCKEPVMLELETGESVSLDITQASFGEGRFLVQGPVPNLRAA